MSLFWIWFWLGVGNYAYALLGAQHWMEAFDRTYFQGIAISGVWIASTMQRWLSQSPQELRRD